MATDRDKATLIEPGQFDKLIEAVRAIAGRNTITTTVEPRALDSTAQEAVVAYNAIARSLRTIFEPVASPVKTQA